MSSATERHLKRLLPVDRWPSEEEAKQLRWFSPIEIGSCRLRTRTWIPAMVPWRASEEGFVTPKVLEWYERFARGKPGAMVVEATGIRDIPSGPLLRIGDDRFVPGLKKLVETVREASEGQTRLFIQLIDFLAVRRRPTRETFIARYLCVDSDLRARCRDMLGVSNASEEALRKALMQCSDEELRGVLSKRDFESLTRGYRERVTDTQLPHIAELPQVLPSHFAAAASRAQQAGFDGVELHYAHAYTMASFLSRHNTRMDGYGGTLEERVRLPLEVYDAVRDAVGKRCAVGVRFLGDEVIEGGSNLDDALFFALEFARAGFDFLSISKGGKFEDAKQPKVGQAIYPYTGPSGHECMPTVRMDALGPFGRNLPLARAVRQAIRAQGFEAPVIAAGGIASPWQAEQALASGDADIIASARQSLCDPDWFLKIEQGEGDAVRRCFFTNYCEALDQAHKEVTCQRWDREKHSSDLISLSKDGKRRLTAPQWAR